jgi:hypothetical protein
VAIEPDSIRETRCQRVVQLVSEFLQPTRSTVRELLPNQFGGCAKGDRAGDALGARAQAAFLAAA